MQYKDKYKKTIPPLLSTLYGNSPSIGTLLMPGNARDEKNTNIIYHSPPGCNAVAMAQIVYYWNSKVCKDTDSFTLRNGNWIASITKTKVDNVGNDCSGYSETSRQIKWSILPLKRTFFDVPNISSTYNSNSKKYVLTGTYSNADKELAEFYLDCATTLPSKFAGSTSVDWSYINKTPYNKFRLNCSGNIMSNISTKDSYIEKLEDLIYNELLYDRPVLMAGWRTDDNDGGHAFICDGYDSGLFHLNFGWTGECSGWFKLGALCGFLQSGGFLTPTISKQGSGDSGKSYTKNLAVKRVYPSNLTPTIISISKNGKHYNDDSFYGITEENKSTIGWLNPKRDLRILDIDTTYCDGNIIPINNSYKSRKQYIRVKIINTSKYDYYDRAIYIYSDNTQIGTFIFNVASGDTIVNEFEWEPSYTTTGTHNITVGTSSSVKLLGINGSIYLKSITFTKRSSYTPIYSGNFDSKFLNNYVYTRKVAANTAFINVISSDNNKDKVINGNSYPICLQIDVYGIACLPTENSVNIRADASNRAILGKVKVTIPSNAKGSNVSLPIIIQNLPREKNMAIVIGYKEDASGNYITKGTIIFSTCPTVNYWTNDGINGKYILAKTSNDDADYSNKDIVIDDSMLAVEFCGITSYKSITPNNNPNTVYIFDSTQTVPASLSGKNIIKGNTANTINLYEGYEMYFPKTFTANKVIYHYTPKEGITKGTNKGWKTISFPFNVNKIECENKEIDWFHSDVDVEKQFWLKGLEGVEYDDLSRGSQYSISWKDVDRIEKDNSYIIAFPGESYDTNSLINKEILFIGENCTFYKSIGFGYKDGTPKTIYSKSNIPYQVPPENILNYAWSLGEHEVWNSTNYRQTTRVIDFCGTTLNRNEQYIYKLSDDGSTFEYSESTQNISPFEAYFKDAYRRIYVNDDLYRPSPNRVKPINVNNIDTSNLEPSFEFQQDIILDNPIDSNVDELL